MSKLRSINLRVGLFLALLAYVPILLTQPGQVSADTKSYLTLDPGRLMSRAWSMWDPMVGAGTVTHQNIGYLFPLGPVYLAADWAGIPDWVTQRLIWGSLVWVAAFGTWKLCRWMGWSILPALVAALAYGWSPYLLSYLARLSVILMPWAALPWLIMLAGIAVRESRWRAPAGFALVIALVGSVNATSLVLVGIGPVLWVLTEWWQGRHHWSDVVAGGSRTLVLTLGVSVWWILGLRIQGTYGLPILDYTETYQVVASSSTPQEIMRGLGYWFFYGGDRLGPWVGPSGVYRSPWMIAVGTILAAISLLGLCTAFVGRSRAVLLLVVGLAVAVGAAPLGASTPYGEVFLRLSTTTVGMALRSTPRAAPLVILALALGLGAAVQWLRERSTEMNRVTQTGTQSTGWRKQVPTSATAIVPGLIVPGLIIVGLLIQIHPWFLGRALTESLQRPSELPGYRQDLVDWLGETGTGRIWEIPGSDFAAYQWGGTVDPVLPGMIDRATLARELVPQGSPGTISLLAALDTRIQEGTFEPSSLAEVARLFGVETIVMRNDLQHERHRLIRPGTLWPRLVAALGQPDFIGPMTTDQPVIPMIDEILLADPLRVDRYPILAAWNLADPRSGTAPAIIGAHPASAQVIAGDGDGIVDLAAAGLIDPERPILYAASDVDPGLWGPRPHLVITDTNAKRARRWSTLGAHSGVIETVDEVAVVDDPGDHRLALFTEPPEGGGDLPGLQTVMVHTGAIASIRATSYGNPFSHTAEDAPHYAMDGDPLTAWRTGVFADLRGQRLEIEMTTPITADHLWILQPTTRVTSRYLTEVAVRLDGGPAIKVLLTDASRTQPGQRIEIPPPFSQVPFSQVSVELVADNLGRARVFTAQPGAGIAEIRIGEVRADPTIQMPTSLLGVLPGFADLDLVMTRLRIDPATPNREDPELRLDRSFVLPDAREFILQGTARISAQAEERLISPLLMADQPAGVVAVDRLAGSVHTWGRAAFDGDPDTAWITGFELGQTRDLSAASVTLQQPSVIEWAEIQLGWRTDPEYSRPTQVTVRAGDQPVRIFDLIGDQPFGSIFDLRGLRSDHIEIQISGMDLRVSPDYISGTPRVLPVAITEIHLHDVLGEAVTLEPLVDNISEQCRTDLLHIDGSPVGLRLRATSDVALQRGPINIELCGDPLVLGAGSHRVVATSPRQTGVDLDRIILRSRANSNVSADQFTPVASPRFERSGPHRFRVTWPVSDTDGWLILRESWNAGWEARIADGPSQPSTLIDGYANGWWIPADAVDREITLEWTPQRVILPGMILSALFLAVILTIIAVAGLGRRKIDLPTEGQTLFLNGAAGLWRSRFSPVVGEIMLTGVLTFVGGPITGLTYLILRLLGRDRLWLAPASAFGLWGVSALWTAALQFGFSFPADPDWPTRFAFASPLAWAAVAAVCAVRPTVFFAESAPSGLG